MNPRNPIETPLCPPHQFHLQGFPVPTVAFNQCDNSKTLPHLTKHPVEEPYCPWVYNTARVPLVQIFRVYLTTAEIPERHLICLCVCAHACTCLVQYHFFSFQQPRSTCYWYPQRKRRHSAHTQDGRSRIEKGTSKRQNDCLSLGIYASVSFLSEIEKWGLRKLNDDLH